MNNIKVYFLSILADTPRRGYWDMAMLEGLLDEFEKVEADTLPEVDYGIVVIPARSHHKLVSEINYELSKIGSCLLFLCGDEEHVFPVEKIKHPSIKIWCQNPQMGRHDNYGKLGTGYTPGIKEFKNKMGCPVKHLDSAFLGQITHARREQMADHFIELPNSHYLPTEGFTKGIDQQEYYEVMATAISVPCPSGPETVDSFRLFEALELGCVPIADSKTPKEDMKGFWHWLFGSDSFPVVDEWAQLKGYTDDVVAQYPAGNNRLQAWWMRQKQNIKTDIHNDLSSLGYTVPRQAVTVVVPVSPIPSHPEANILMETLNSIRYHLPDSRIVLMFDGVRQEQEGMRGKYEEHIRRVLWEVSEWKDVMPIIFDEHLHQSGMLKSIINLIDTPLLLFVEQDTPLVIDEPIDWGAIEQFIVSGKSNVVRLYHEGQIPEEHEGLMIGEDGKFIKTYQWSSRPHLASTAFYKNILDKYFSEKAKCFTEDLLHGKVQEDYLKYKEQGWNLWRLHIYCPDKKNLKRSYHTNGRAGAKKYDTSQIF